MSNQFKLPGKWKIIENGKFVISTYSTRKFYILHIFLSHPQISSKYFSPVMKSINNIISMYMYMYVSIECFTEECQNSKMMLSYIKNLRLNSKWNWPYDLWTFEEHFLHNSKHNRWNPEIIKSNIYINLHEYKSLGDLVSVLNRSSVALACFTM